MSENGRKENGPVSRPGNPEEFEAKELLARAVESGIPEAVEESADRIGKGAIFSIRRMQIGRKRGKRIRLTVALLLIATGFVVYGRYSSTFHTYLANAEGNKQVSAMMREDEGLWLSAQSGLLQRIHQTKTSGGVTVTVQALIADGTRLVIYYTVRHGQVTLQWDDDAVQQETVIQRDQYPAPETAGDVISHLVSYDYRESGEVPQAVTLRMTPVGGTGDPLVFRIPVRHDRFSRMSEEMAVNRSFTVGGQTVIVRRLRAFPTRTKLELEFANGNEKRIFGFGELRLEDEQGNTWISKAALAPDSRHRLLLFESGYLAKPKHLYLAASRVYALETELLRVTVDLETGRMLSGPDDLQLVRVDQLADGGSELVFRLSAKLDGSPHCLFSNTFLDGEGVAQAGDGGRTAVQGEIRYPLQAGTIGPVSLMLEQYPSAIEEPFRIQIR